MAEPKSIPLTPGPGRHDRGARWASGLTGRPDGDWFGPLLAPPTMAPPSVKAAAVGFPRGHQPGLSSPGATSPSPSLDLRGLAQNCDLVRLAIETRKDQIGKMDWTVKPLNPVAR